MSAHQRMCELNPKRDYYIQQIKDSRLKGSVIAHKNAHDRVEATRKIRTFVCENPKCHKEFTKNLTDTEFKRYQSKKHFCCRSCANARIHTAESRAKVSASLAKRQPVDRICRKCGRHYLGIGVGYCPECKSGGNVSINGTKRTYTKRIIRYEKCELRKTNCLDCQKEVYVKTTADVYCKECIDNHPEYHRFQIFTSDGRRILSTNERKAISDRIKAAVKNGTHKGWKTRPIASYPEIFWKKVLENNHIEYEFNYPIRKSSLGLQHEAACYFLDFKLKDNIDLEIDGKQHKYPERKTKDLERDTLLKKNGWIIYRIEWNEISSEEGSKLMKKKIDDFLQWYHIQ